MKTKKRVYEATQKAHKSVFEDDFFTSSSSSSSSSSFSSSPSSVSSASRLLFLDFIANWGSVAIVVNKVAHKSPIKRSRIANSDVDREPPEMTLLLNQQLICDFQTDAIWFLTRSFRMTSSISAEVLSHCFKVKSDLGQDLAGVAMHTIPIFPTSQTSLSFTSDPDRALLRTSKKQRGLGTCLDSAASRGKKKTTSS